MKLKTKINVLTALVASVILALSFIAVYFTYKSMAISTEFDLLQARGDDLAKAVSALESAEGIDTLIRAYLPTDGYIVVKSDQQDLIRMQATSVPLPASDDFDSHELLSIQGVDHLVIAYPLIWPEVGIAEALFVQPVPHIANNLNVLRWILISLMALAIIPIFLASNWLARMISHPILSLTKTMQHNIQNKTYTHIDVTNTKDELAAMTSTYNELMTKMEDIHLRQQQFIGNASHELKTPLTVVESYTNLLLRRGVTDENLTQEALDAISSEAKTMKQLIEQMLELTKSSELASVHVTTFNLESLLSDLAKQSERTFNRSINLNCEQIYISTDENKLKQLLFILIDNAQKYSESVTPVELKAERLAEAVVITVRDFGVGIPPEDVPHIFDRFYRVTKDRNRKTGGTGLGLAIAKQLAELLHIELYVESIVGEGTTIQLRLPLEVMEGEV